MQAKYGIAKDFYVLIHSFHETVSGLADDTMSIEYQQILPELGIKRGGGRISSPKLREMQEQCEEFTGLEEGVNKYDLLLLVKRAGRSCGFSPRMIELLDYYMSFSKDIDWEEGSAPIIYQSLSKTALDLGVSERQIQKLEKALFEAGALTWRDSGNHKRYGQRCPETGAIIYAYGVDLTPLAYLKAELQQKLHEKQLYDKAWMEAKRQISWYRRQVRGLISELERIEDVDWGMLAKFDHHYDEIAMQIRTHMKLEDLHDLLNQHKELYAQLVNEAKEMQQTRYQVDNESHDTKTTKTEISSCTSEQRVTHYKYTNHKPFDKSNYSSPTPKSFQESVAASPELNLRSGRTHAPKSRGGDPPSETGSKEKDLVLQTGLQHVTLKQLLNVATPRFRSYIPIEGRALNVGDIIEAAYQLREHLEISQKSWAEACKLLGRMGAATCVILTDQGTTREEDPVKKPGAYFRSMMNRARSGELKLHQSVMGHLKKEHESAAHSS